uniref:Tc1-like transposase DDE domain-containing protein n=1 Tax=Oncorhynchus tshawytscha TaxID=74940 RepID=A0AAZ3Q021_ONCTS
MNIVTVQVSSAIAILQETKTIEVQEFFKSLLLSFSPNLDEYNPDVPEWKQDVGRVIKKALLQDHDPKHTSRLCKGYMTKKEGDGVLHQMSWPPQSPDLNPNEMVWDELDRRVKEKQAISAQHMWELLQDCWKIIPGEAN